MLAHLQSGAHSLSFPGGKTLRALLQVIELLCQYGDGRICVTEHLEWGQKLIRKMPQQLQTQQKELFCPHVQWKTNLMCGFYINFEVRLSFFEALQFFFQLLHLRAMQRNHLKPFLPKTTCPKTFWSWFSHIDCFSKFRTVTDSHHVHTVLKVALDLTPIIFHRLQLLFKKLDLQNNVQGIKIYFPKWPNTTSYVLVYGLTTSYLLFK